MNLLELILYFVNSRTLMAQPSKGGQFDSEILVSFLSPSIVSHPKMILSSKHNRKLKRKMIF